MINKITQGDCLEIMKDIPDGSIDMILTDPPYGTIGKAWDVVIPFDLMWKQLNRIIKSNGAIALFGSEPFSSALRMSNMSMYRYDWYWVKSKFAIFQHAKNRPLKIIEIISMFSKAKWGHAAQVKNRMRYYPQGVKSVGMATVRNQYSDGSVHGFRPNQDGKSYEAFTGFPTDKLVFQSVTSKDSKHPTQKPVALIEHLIKTYTNENETVLDFTIGSGTTAVAAIQTGRNFIGIEKEKEYCDIAKQRIEKAYLGVEWDKLYKVELPNG